MLPYINEPFKHLHGLTGASVDELKLMFSFLLSYPLAVVLKRLPDDKPWQKNLFTIAVSIFYLVGLFDLWAGLGTLVISSVGTYAIAYYVDGTFMPWIAFVFLMCHMSYSHVYRQMVNDPSQWDVTGAQMVLIMKLHGMCWNIHDGRLKPELLTEQQKDRAIYKLPEFLDYAGYVLYFPSLMAGPAFEYVDYRRWLDNSLFDVAAGTPGIKTRPGHKIPRSGTPAAWKAAYGIFWILLFLQASKYITNNTVLSDTFMSHSFPTRVFLLYLLGFVTRLKYYGTWTLTEGACILAGIGFNGIDPQTGKALWNKVENVNPWMIETAQNSRAYLDGWNRNTNAWLRNYMYLRVTPKGKKPGFRASLATFITSAFWHGFYPGYYLTFLLGAFIQTVAKNFRRYIRPFFLTPDGKRPTKNKIYYDIASYFATQLAFCFTTLPFCVLRADDSIKVWARVYFYTIIGVAASMAFFVSPAKSYLITQIKKRNGSEETAAAQKVETEKEYMPSLGMPDDPGREIDEALDEIKAEVEMRRRRGSKVSMPGGADLRIAVEQKLGKKLAVQDGKVRVE